MRRMGLAGLLFAATVAVPGAVAPGLAPAAASPGGDGSARTGDLIALVRSPRIAVAIEPSKRESLLDTTRRRISAVIARSGVSAVRSIPELGAVAVRPAPGDSLGRARRELQADPAVNKVEVEHFRTLRYLPDDPALADHDALAPSHDFYQWNLRQEHFPNAWKRTRGAKARLAIIDTGLDGAESRSVGEDRLLEGLRLPRLRWTISATVYGAAAR